MTDIETSHTSAFDEAVVQAELAEVVSYLEDADYQPIDAYKEMIDIYMSYNAKLSDDEKPKILSGIFAFAKEHGIEHEVALEIWQEIAEKESN